MSRLKKLWEYIQNNKLEVSLYAICGVVLIILYLQMPKGSLTLILIFLIIFPIASIGVLLSNLLIKDKRWSAINPSMINEKSD